MQHNLKNSRALFSVGCAALMAALNFAGFAVAETEEAPEQKVTAKGELVRLGYNDEGWVVLGYRTANNSLEQEWMLLEVGMTLVRGGAEQALARDAVTLTTPDGKTIQLASQEAFNKANLRALDARANQVRDSLNYFPRVANQACRIGFFTDFGTPKRGLAYDRVSLDYRRGCLGRLYFQIPEGIEYGRYHLNVKFADSVVMVPFKIMTKDELKEAKAEYKELEKEAKQKAKEEKKAAKNKG